MNVQQRKPKVFIGSSIESLDVADAIQIGLEHYADVTIWTQEIFGLGSTPLEALETALSEHDFAILICSGDDLSLVRNQEESTIRDNVLFELGLFIGRLGRKRCFMVVPRGDIRVKIPSDLNGITYADYDSERAKTELSAALGTPIAKIKAAIKQKVIQDGLAMLPSSSPNSGNEANNEANIDFKRIGLVKIYSSYAAAETQILEDLNSASGTIRMFLQVGTLNITGKGTIFDIIERLAVEKSVEIRILHASEESPLFERTRLISLGKNPDAIQETLRYVNRSLSQFDKTTKTSLRHRKHNLPFIWRLYIFDNKLYLMPYFAKKDAIKYSPVLMFEKTDNSLYNILTNWFDYVWEQFAPKHISISDLITPATRAGTALFLKWEGFHVFGIPKRDIANSPTYVRFYGIGGKRRDADESFGDCALRESTEEIGPVISEIINADETQFLKANGTIESIDIKDSEKRPRLILEKRSYTAQGDQTQSDDSYYLVAFDAKLHSRPKPAKEIAALLYLTDAHLNLIKQRMDITIAELKRAGAQIDCQSDIDLSDSAIVVPHGTAYFLIRQLPE